MGVIMQLTGQINFSPFSPMRRVLHPHKRKNLSSAPFEPTLPRSAFLFAPRRAQFPAGSAMSHLGKPILVLILLSAASGLAVLSRRVAAPADLTVWVFTE